MGLHPKYIPISAKLWRKKKNKETYIQNFKQFPLLGGFLHPQHNLPHIRTGLILFPDSNADRVVNQSCSKLLSPCRDSCRHQQCLRFFRYLLQNLQHLLLEAHFQHGVDLQDIPHTQVSLSVCLHWMIFKERFCHWNALMKNINIMSVIPRQWPPPSLWPAALPSALRSQGVGQG